MSVLSSAFNRLTGQRLSDAIGGAVFRRQQAPALAGGGVLLIGAAALGAFLLLRKK